MAKANDNAAVAGSNANKATGTASDGGAYVTDAEASRKGAEVVAAQVRTEKRKLTAAMQKQARGDRELSNAEKFQLSQLSIAGRACKMLAERIRSGRPVELESLQAASTLAGAANSSMLD